MSEACFLQVAAGAGTGVEATMASLDLHMSGSGIRKLPPWFLLQQSCKRRPSEHVRDAKATPNRYSAKRQHIAGTIRPVNQGMIASRGTSNRTTGSIET